MSAREDKRRQEDKVERGRARQPSQGGEPPRGAAAGSSTRPLSTSNPLIAEVARLARQRLGEAQRGEERSTAVAESAEDAPVDQVGWRSGAADMEPGELDPESEGPGAAQGAGRPGKRPRHSPIVWGEQGAKEQAGMEQVASTQELGSLAKDAAKQAPPGAKRSMVDIAQAELMAFAQDQGAGESAGCYMKPSPSISSEEEDMHIKREGDLAGMPGGDDARMPGSEGAAGDNRVSRWNDAEDQATLPPEPAGATEQPLQPGEPEPAGAPESPSDDNGAGDWALGLRPVSMLDECRSVEIYEKLNRISEGTYGVVYRARNQETGRICALKKVKLDKERDGFPLTSVREINILLSLHHPNIVNVSEVVVGTGLDAVFMVMEYAEHDLKSVMESRMQQPFTIAEVKCLLQQLLRGVAYLHENWVIHRDLKTSNILYTNRGELKICDFGLARQYGDPLKPYTKMVITLWYRPPELLLGAQKYSTAVDMWSIGCIFAELLTKEPLFPGKVEIDQVDRIFKLLGTPAEETWPGLSKLPHFRTYNFKLGLRSTLRQKFPAPPLGQMYAGSTPALSDAGYDLLVSLLQMCPEKRITAHEALQHRWFSEHPAPKDAALMPTFPATNEALHGHHAAARPAMGGEKK